MPDLTEEQIRELPPSDATWDELFALLAREGWFTGTQELLALRNALPELLRGYRDRERLRGVLRWTHKTYCSEDYTARGRHAPECLLYEIGEE